MDAPRAFFSRDDELRECARSYRDRAQCPIAADPEIAALTREQINSLLAAPTALTDGERAVRPPESENIPRQAAA